MSAKLWSDLLPLWTILLSSLEGIGVVPIVDYIKGKLVRLVSWLFKRDIGKLPGEASLLITFAVCLILAGLTLIVQKQITQEHFTAEHIVATFVAVFVMAKVRYDMSRRQNYTPTPRRDYSD